MPSAVEALPCGSRSMNEDVQAAERQPGGEVHGGGGLAHATLLVRDHEHPCGAGLGQRRGRSRGRRVDRVGSGCGLSATSPVSNSSRSNFARRGPGGLDTGASVVVPTGSLGAAVSRETSAWPEAPNAAAERATASGETSGRTTVSSTAGEDVTVSRGTSAGGDTDGESPASARPSAAVTPESIPTTSAEIQVGIGGLTFQGQFVARDRRPAARQPVRSSSPASGGSEGGSDCGVVRTSRGRRIPACCTGRPVRRVLRWVDCRCQVNGSRCCFSFRRGLMVDADRVRGGVRFSRSIRGHRFTWNGQITRPPQGTGPVRTDRGQPRPAAMRGGTARLRLILLLFPAAHSTLCEGADAHRAARWTPGRWLSETRWKPASATWLLRGDRRRMNPEPAPGRKPIRAEGRDREFDVRAVRVPRMRVWVGRPRVPACDGHIRDEAHRHRGPPLTGGRVLPYLGRV